MHIVQEEYINYQSLEKKSDDEYEEMIFQLTKDSEEEQFTLREVNEVEMREIYIKINRSENYTEEGLQEFLKTENYEYYSLQIPSRDDKYRTKSQIERLKKSETFYL